VVPAGYSSISTDDGRTRTYKVVDLSNGEDDVPMVLVVHGFGGSAEAMSAYTGIEAALAEAGVDAVVVYPNGSGADEGSPQSWNAGGCCPFAMYGPVDDVSFFTRLISTVEADYSTDPDQVWFVGHSNGGMMGYRLACEVADKVSAIGVAAGALMVDACAPSRPINVLHLHGELDAVVPLNGGDAIGIVFPPTQQSVDRYADAAGCDPASSTTANTIDRACGAARVSLVVDATWTHDWQPDWSRRFVDFFVATSRA
jgi:polyhydroxybutyrate depolymerase